MTRPGTPPLPGRRPPSESAGDVPPFYWLSTADTGSRPAAPNRSDRAGVVFDHHFASDPPNGDYPGVVPAPRGDAHSAHPQTGYYEAVAGSPGHDGRSYDGPSYDSPSYESTSYESSAYEWAGYDDDYNHNHYGGHAYGGGYVGDTSYGGRAHADHAYGDPGYGDPGYGDPGYGDPGYGDQRYGDRGHADHGPALRTDTGGFRQAAGLLDRASDETGPIVEPEWWHHYPGDELPSAGGPALPARPPSPWERLAQHHAASDGGADHGDTPAQHDPTSAYPAVPPSSGSADPTGDSRNGESDSTPHHADAGARSDDRPARDGAPPAWDETGGLEVIGAHVEEPGRRRRRWRRDPADATGNRGDAPRDADDARDGDVLHDDADDGYPHGRHADPGGGVHDGDHGEGRHDGPVLRDEDIPLRPYDPTRGRQRRRRRPLAILLSLVVLAGLVVGIVVGGQALLRVIDPSSRDFTGQGTGSVDIRVSTGDTLSDIARTLVEAGVIASIGPFIDAAEDEPAATSIQPGVYSLRQEMSGQAALDLLLDPASRMLARVTIPEGLTVQAILQRIADATGTPVEDLQSAAQDPTSLGLPAYANGQLEGFLFPATYDFEPDMTATEMLRKLVNRFTEMATSAQLEQRAAALGRTPYEIVTIASMVESETRLDAERPDVAQVIYNRLGRDMPLGIDATLAYGLGKNGNELTVSDLQTDSPYNTRTRKGLPPTPISAPGEASLEAALSPSSGDYLYYVLQSDAGEHFFTSSAAEFEAARQRCADAGLGCGGG